MESVTEIYSCGDGRHGTLGLGTKGVKIVGEPEMVDFTRRDNVVSISTGLYHTAVVTARGDVYTWGFGQDGQLGHGDFENVSKPRPVNGVAEITKISSGAKHTCAVDKDGTVYSWGEGAFGKLGLGDTETMFFPSAVEEFGTTRDEEGNVTEYVQDVQCGAEYTLALTSRGRVFSWGSGLRGVLGHAGESSESKPREIERFVQPQVVEKPAEGQKQQQQQQGLVRKQEGHSAGKSMGNVVISSIASGPHHCAAISNEGILFMWGDGGDGRLGNGTEEPQWVPMANLFFMKKRMSVTKIACGERHSVAMVSVGDAPPRVYTWGRGDFGSLGHGNSKSVYLPLLVEAFYEMEITVKDIFAGGGASFAVSANDNLYAWGCGSSSQLATDKERDEYVPTKCEAFGMGEMTIHSVASSQDFTIVVAVVQEMAGGYVVGRDDPSAALASMGVSSTSLLGTTGGTVRTSTSTVPEGVARLRSGSSTQNLRRQLVRRSDASDVGPERRDSGVSNLSGSGQLGAISEADGSKSPRTPGRSPAGSIAGSVVGSVAGDSDMGDVDQYGIPIPAKTEEELQEERKHEYYLSLFDNIQAKKWEIREAEVKEAARQKRKGRAATEMENEESDEEEQVWTFTPRILEAKLRASMDPNKLAKATGSGWKTPPKKMFSWEPDKVVPGPTFGFGDRPELNGVSQSPGPIYNLPSSFPTEQQKKEKAWYGSGNRFIHPGKLFVSNLHNKSLPRWDSPAPNYVEKFRPTSSPSWTMQPRRESGFWKTNGESPGPIYKPARPDDNVPVMRWSNPDSVNPKVKERLEAARSEPSPASFRINFDAVEKNVPAIRFAKSSRPPLNPGDPDLPGPDEYFVEGQTRDGKGFSPRFSITGKGPNTFDAANPMADCPGPQYNPNVESVALGRPASFGFGDRPPLSTPNDGPGPDAYMWKRERCDNYATLKGRNFRPEQFEDGPGPGAYMVSGAHPSFADPPKFSMTGRNYPPESNTQKGGPGPNFLPKGSMDDKDFTLHSRYPLPAALPPTPSPLAYRVAPPMGEAPAFSMQGRNSLKEKPNENPSPIQYGRVSHHKQLGRRPSHGMITFGTHPKTKYELERAEKLAKRKATAAGC